MVEAADKQDVAELFHKQTVEANNLVTNIIVLSVGAGLVSAKLLSIESFIGFYGSLGNVGSAFNGLAGAYSNMHRTRAAYGGVLSIESLPLEQVSKGPMFKVLVKEQAR